MSEAYVVGHISVKNAARWAEYCSRVPPTLEPWGAELVFRGVEAAVMAGDALHPAIVVIRFPTLSSVQGWFGSDAYQALIPIREQAADVTLVSYAT